jgi:hypothetical protein
MNREVLVPWVELKKLEDVEKTQDPGTNIYYSLL